MAKLPSKNTFASETADSFGGIDRTDSVGKLSEAYDMANLRILPDGSLTRREGYRAFVSFHSPIRCAMACPTDPNYMFVLAGEYLYSVNLTTNRCIELSRGFNTYAPALFCQLSGLVYLLCEGVCAMAPDELIFVNSYIPLVGQDWGVDGGEIHEPQNMLGFQIRIDYLMDRESNVLFTGFDVSAVDAVYVNGNAVTGATVDRKHVRLPAFFPAGTRVLLCLSLALSEIHNILSLYSCTAAYSYGHGTGSTVVLYGGEEPERLFFVTKASDEQVAQAQVYYPNSGDLYCEVKPTLVKGLAGGVRAVCGEADCLIVAGQHETRRLTPDGDTPIPGMAGCEASSSMTYYEGTAYIANQTGVYRLPLRSGNGELISAPLGDLMGPNISKTALLYYNVYRDELLVKNTVDVTQTVYVYDPHRRIWISFTNISAEGFFELGETRHIGFWSQLQLMKFVDDQDYDLLPGSAQFSISAYYISRWTCLGKPDAPKRLRRAKLTHTGGSQVAAMIADGIGDVCRHLFAPASGSTPRFSDDPIRSGRTDRFQAALLSDDKAPLRIHEFALSAIK